MTRQSPAALLRCLLWRDVTLAWRRRSDVFGTLIFFVLVVTLFPLGVGPDTALLRTIAPGVVWVAALLAAMLSLARLFTEDHADGTLEQMLLAPQPLWLVVGAKVLAQWLVSAVPLILVAPFVAVQFGLRFEAPMVLTMSLLLGTPVILLVGAIGAGLTLGLRGAGSLTSLLVMPLCIPTLVFGAGAVQAVVVPGAAEASLRLLAALLILAVLFAPWAAAAALRTSLE
jgi:heme exporter protein B